MSFLAGHRVAVLGNMGERALANSLVLAASGLGAAVTPPLIGGIMSSLGWRESFYFCGFLGLGVAVLWHLSVTDRPEQHERVGAAELDRIRAGPDAGRRRGCGHIPLTRKGEGRQ